ncbi:MAG TPA: TonB-dependent receptor, partial [Novosphingobium sp.]|nr:TonB-dependent receptor [Novosphingobium sp.]
MNSIHTVKFGLLAATALGLGMATPAFAAAEDGAASGSDIIVTARRVEERLQDVPISITVLSGETISENNIVSASDIANFTPNLSVNRRFGDDGSTFTIRGFNQENGTAATVGVYFADVVMLRGGGESSNGGDGAGPGQLYDLENIQVLKGPQGTLQGRNSTGGAVLLVPTKPKSDFGGYVEGSLGDYDLRRVQAAVNVPVGDTFRFRLAGDRMKRKGYLKNLGFPGANGPRDFADTNYTSLRFSAVADLSPDVENYTIVSYTKSDNNGVIPAIKQCVPGVAVAGIPLGNMACAQIAREAPSGFWTVSNGNFEGESYVRTWQVINTTTVQLSDAVEFKNIFSYGELKARQQLDFFGTYFPLVPADQVTGPAQIITFVPNAAAQPYNRTINQSTMVEEMRLSGSALDGKLDWQGGLYWELSTPLGFSGQQYGQLTPCADTPTLTCTPRGGTNVTAGSINYNIYKSRFEGKAIYGQASYSFTEQLSLTGGLRYTWDEVTKTFSRNARTATGAPALVNILPTLAFTAEEAKFDAPTWLIGLDYKPTRDVLIYAKYSRGYRQGSINASSGPGLRK